LQPTQRYSPIVAHTSHSSIVSSVEVLSREAGRLNAIVRRESGVHRTEVFAAPEANALHLIDAAFGGFALVRMLNHRSTLVVMSFTSR